MCCAWRVNRPIDSLPDDIDALRAFALNAVAERDRLTERFALMQSELGGLFYEMAIRDHVQMDVLIAIHKRLPHTHLVMHGSSSVPKDLQEIINKYGGKLTETWGVPVEEIQLGIRNGVRKINVDTDNRLAITGAIRKVFAESPEKFDPRDYMKPAREAMMKVVAARMTEFGQAGHAGDYKPIPITDIAKGYADGSLTTQPLVAAK